MDFGKMGKDKEFGLNTSVPNMSGTLTGWMQKLTFDIITKTIENYEVKEVAERFVFEGVFQPLSFKQLQMKPELQRAWSWFQIHSQTNIYLKLDDVIRFRGKQYRVMFLGEYELYGFYEYHVCEDYEGSGPEVLENESGEGGGIYGGY